MYQNEEVIVGAVLGPRTLKLTKPLLYTHRSAWYTYNGRQVDMRVEVGLLTRNVVVQGDENSDAQLFGVHTMAMHSGTALAWVISARVVAGDGGVWCRGVARHVPPVRHGVPAMWAERRPGALLHALPHGG